MAKKYRVAKPAESKVLRTVLSKWHEDLAASNVRIVLVFVEMAKGGKAPGRQPCFTFGGLGCPARTNIANGKDRLIANYDMSIEVDLSYWSGYTAGQRLALLDHELSHVALARDRKGSGQKNIDGSVKLSRCPHDWVIACFKDVLERHGVHSLEVTSIKAVADACQAQFAFMFAPSDADATSLPKLCES